MAWAVEWIAHAWIALVWIAQGWTWMVGVMKGVKRVKGDLRPHSREAWILWEVVRVVRLVKGMQVRRVTNY